MQKKTLERLDSLDSSYNNLIAKLDNELKQSGSLAKALTLSKDSNPETTLDIFKKAFKV